MTHVYCYILKMGASSTKVHATITKQNQEYHSEMNRIKVRTFCSIIFKIKKTDININFDFDIILDGTMDSNALSNKRKGISFICFKITWAFLLAWCILFGCIRQLFQSVNINNFVNNENEMLTKINVNIFRFQKTKRPGVLAPLIPLSFVLAYYADLAYGSKIHRIRGTNKPYTTDHDYISNWFCFNFLILAEADMIMQNEPELLEWPCGLPTVSSIDQARVDTEIEKRLHPSTS